MIINYDKLIGQRVKILLDFGSKNPIYYDGIIERWEPANNVLIIKDRFDKTVYIDATTVKQLVVV